MDLKTIDKIEMWRVECPECREDWYVETLELVMTCPKCNATFEIVREE